jgi:hypothetical protein
MKAPPRPLSQKRAAEGAARRSTHLPLRHHEPILNSDDDKWILLSIKSTYHHQSSDWLQIGNLLGAQSGFQVWNGPDDY